MNKRATLDIVQQFAKMGYQSNLISAKTKSNIESNQSNQNITLIPLRHLPFIIPLFFGIIMAFFLPIYILVKKPQYIITEPNVHVIFSLPCLIVARLTRVKMVLDIRTVPVENFRFRGVMERMWFSVSIQIAKKFYDGMTILTSLMRQEVCVQYGIDSKKVGVWTSGVSKELFNPNNTMKKSTALKKALNLEKKFVVFYHGVFTPSRGLDKTLQAVKIINRKYSDIVIFLLGNGPAEESLKEYIIKESLQKNVVIHPKVEQKEVPAYIGLSDVGIVPLPNNIYWRFQSPLKLLEYLSMNKVVILSDIPAHRTVVNSKTCAIYLNQVSPEDIARAIIYSYENKSKLSSWGSIGRKIIEKDYTWDKVARNLESYLNSLDKYPFSNKMFCRLKD